MSSRVARKSRPLSKQLQGDNHISGGEGKATGGDGGNARTGNVQVLNGNSIAAGLGHGSVTSSGGDSSASSGDAYGGNGGDASATGGDARGGNQSDTSQKNVASGSRDGSRSDKHGCGCERPSQGPPNGLPGLPGPPAGLPGPPAGLPGPLMDCVQGCFSLL